MYNIFHLTHEPQLCKRIVQSGAMECDTVYSCSPEFIVLDMKKKCFGKTVNAISTTNERSMSYK